MMHSNTVTLKLRSVFVAELLQGEVFKLTDYLDELVTPTKGPVEGGFVCNRCNRSLDGPRWHCETCWDYDLCESCQPLGHEHPLQMLGQRGAPQPKQLKLFQLDIAQMLGSGPSAEAPGQNLLRQLAKERQDRAGSQAKKQKTQAPEVIDLS